MTQADTHPPVEISARLTPAMRSVLQAMAKLMEQGSDIVVGQQCRFSAYAAGKVTYEMGNRGLQLVRVRAQPSRACIVHPGATTFARACLRVQIELTYQLR